MKKLMVAKSAGFCFGVSRSVKMAEEMLAAEQNCYSLGELIHNDDVVQHLRSEGLTVVDGPEQIPQGASVIIRSHGELKSVLDDLEGRGVHCDEIAETQGGFFIDPAKRQLVAERLPKYQSIQFPGI